MEDQELRTFSSVPAGMSIKQHTELSPWRAETPPSKENRIQGSNLRLLLTQLPFGTESGFYLKN